MDALWWVKVSRNSGRPHLFEIGSTTPVCGSRKITRTPNDIVYDFENRRSAEPTKVPLDRVLRVPCGECAERYRAASRP